MHDPISPTPPSTSPNKPGRSSKAGERSSIRQWIEARLFKDEKVESVQHSVTYNDRFGSPMVGAMYLTKIQLIFIEDESPHRLFIIRLRTIRKIKKIHSKSEKTMTKLRIFCKDIRTVTFSAFQTEWNDFIENIMKLAFPPTETDLPAFVLNEIPLPATIEKKIEEDIEYMIDNSSEEDTGSSHRTLVSRSQTLTDRKRPNLKSVEDKISVIKLSAKKKNCIHRN